MPFADIEDAIAAVGEGEMGIVVDDADRENEGDLVMAAEYATPDKIAFFLNHTSGVICIPLTGDRLDALDLPPMVQENTESHRTAFTVSVDYRHGTTTGISAFDRCATIQALIDPATGPEDLARPGHIFPLRAVEGGVLRRAGHTEAAVDLARLAGYYPAGVLCEVLDDDGTMARTARLREIATQFRMAMISVKDLIAYRRRSEKLVRRAASAQLPTPYGEFTIHIYEAAYEEAAHAAVVRGEPHNDPSPLVRVHSQCLTGDIFASQRCDCGAQRDQA